MSAGSVTLARRFHIGDTPMDLQAAEGAGAQGVGVTTGVYTREELKVVSPGKRVGHASSSPPDCCQYVPSARLHEAPLPRDHESGQVCSVWCLYMVISSIRPRVAHSLPRLSMVGHGPG